MKQYEGMFIFHPTADDQALDEQINKVGADIKRLGGKLSGTTRMGRSNFARPMRKKDAGIYVLINFELDPKEIDALRKRYRLNEDLLRVQIFLATTASAKPVAETAEV